MKPKLLAIGMLAILALPAVMPDACAGTLNPVTYGGAISLAGQSASFTGSPVSLGPNADGSVSASSSLAPVPTITFSGSSSLSDLNRAAGGISLEFAFEVCPLTGCGGAPGAFVNVEVRAAGSINVNLDAFGAASGISEFQVAQGSNGAGTLVTAGIGCSGSPFCTTSRQGSWTLDTPVSVALNTQNFAFMDLGSGVGGTFFGQIDPMFTVDTTQYQLLFSPGVVNGDPVATPVPAAFPLFVSGLGLLGWAAKRRGKNKKAVAVAAA
jgi:hypothetical protein